MNESLNARQLAFVAAYLGEARFHVTNAAIAAGYSPKTAYSQGSDLLKKPEIQAAIQAWRDKVKTHGVADLDYRVARLDELEQKYWKVIEARAAELGNDPKAAGGQTGMITREHRIVGVAGDTRVLTSYVADVALTKELRAIYDDAAKEMGQRVAKHETKLDASESFAAALRQFGLEGQGSDDA